MAQALGRRLEPLFTQITNKITFAPQIWDVIAVYYDVQNKMQECVEMREKQYRTLQVAGWDLGMLCCIRLVTVIRIAQICHLCARVGKASGRASTPCRTTNHNRQQEANIDTGIFACASHYQTMQGTIWHQQGVYDCCGMRKQVATCPAAAAATIIIYFFS